MFAKLALVFLLVLVAEIALLIQVGQWIEFWPMVAWIVGTGVFGAWLARLQGQRVLGAIRVSLSRGELPAEALVDGLLVLLAGVLLMAPGLLTDACGLVLLVPPLRAVMRRGLRKRLEAQVLEGVQQRFGLGVGPGVFGGPGMFGGPPGFVDVTPPGASSSRRRGDDGEVLDGELIDITPEHERSDLSHR